MTIDVNWLVRVIGLRDALAGAGLIAGIVGLGLNWRLRLVQRRESARLRAEVDRSREECVAQIGQMHANLEDAERNAQQSAELLRDGRLNLATRARALRMLRAGTPAETAATELGMARSEVRLLQKVAAVLTAHRG